MYDVSNIIVLRRLLVLFQPPHVHACIFTCIYMVDMNAEEGIYGSRNMLPP